MQNIAKNKNLFILLISLIGAFILFPNYFHARIYSLKDFSQNWFSLDPSWNLCITTAFKNNLKWGEDFSLTYGPLGFLSTRTLLGINRNYLLLYDIFIATNFILIFYASVKKADSMLPISFQIALVAISIPIHLGGSTSILLFALLLFWLKELISKQNYLTLSMSITLSVLLLFMKFNTGLISLLLLIVTWGFVFWQKNTARIKVIFSASLFLCIFSILSIALNVSIIPYFKNGIHMVLGYPDIMFLNQGKYLELFSAIGIITASLSVLALQLKHTNFYHKLILLFLFLTSSYIIYKQAFTRADENHIKEFFCYYPLLILVFLNPETTINPILKRLPIVITLVCCFFVIKPDPAFSSKTIKRINKAGYITGFNCYKTDYGIYLDTNQNQLPSKILRKISREKIDAYPWNIIELFENKLNIANRPVCQSYTAYTKELEQLNANFYNSEKAPEYVIYDYSSIDGRYPLTDEPLLNLEYFYNYSVCDTFTSYGRLKLLLKRNDTHKEINFIESKEYELKIDDKIYPKKNTYYRIYVNKTLFGELRSLFYFPPQILLQISTGNNKTNEFKTSRHILESGLFSNRFYTSTNDVLNMFNKIPATINDSIEFYKIRSVNEFCFGETIKVKEYEIRN